MLEVAALPESAAMRNSRLVCVEIDCAGCSAEAVDRCVSLMHEAAARKELTAKYVSMHQAESRGPRQVGEGTTRDLVNELRATCEVRV